MPEEGLNNRVDEKKYIAPLWQCNQCGEPSEVSQTVSQKEGRFKLAITSVSQCPQGSSQKGYKTKSKYKGIPEYSGVNIGDHQRY